MSTTRRHVLAGLAAATLAGPALASDAVTLDDINAYLNGLTTAEGRFTQVDADGVTSTGQIWIKRPGRMRFNYDPPVEAMVIAGGGALAVFDPRSDTPSRYPLRQTPLWLLLERNVDLAGSETLAGFVSDESSATLRAQDPDYAEYGFIDLTFAGSPLALRQWVIHDGAGGQTTVTLDTLETGGRVPNRLFNLIAEQEAWAER
ncbi:MAG: outer membrane lipoprotein carrier protein LolA [Pseudomonadota bacterium]